MSLSAYIEVAASAVGEDALTTGAVIAAAVPLMWAAGTFVKEVTTPARNYLVALTDRAHGQREHERVMHSIMTEILTRLDHFIQTYERFHERFYGPSDDA